MSISRNENTGYFETVAAAGDENKDIAFDSIFSGKLTLK
jgi:hypothetical protein